MASKKKYSNALNKYNAAKLCPTNAGAHPQPKGTFEKTSVVHSALFSRDGSKVLIATGREIRIWYTTAGAQKWAREPHRHLPPLSDENRLNYAVPKSPTPAVAP